MTETLPKRPSGLAAMRAARVFVGLVLLVGASFVLESLQFTLPVQRDSAHHLTAAREILRGRVMYRDLWDNRTPGLHYANAAAFALLGEGLHAVHVCNVVMMTACVLIFLRLARRLYDPPTSLVLCGLFLIHLGAPPNRDEINSMEMAMILPAMLAVLFTLRAVAEPRPKWCLLAGACACLAVVVKQPAATTALTFGASTWLVDRARGRDLRVTLKAWLWALIGAGVVLAPWLVYFGGHGALAALWEAAFIYNFHFRRGIGIVERLSVAAFGLTHAGSALPLWAGAFGIGAWLTKHLQIDRNAGGGSWVQQARRLIVDHPAWTVVVLWALLDLVAVIYTGFKAPHYFIQILPSWFLMAGYAFHGISSKWLTRFPRRAIVPVTVLLIALILWAPAMSAHVEALRSRSDPENLTLGEAVALGTGALCPPGDTVCVWGAASEVYFLAERRVASRYFFTYPLQMPGYDNERRIEEFLADLRRTRPAYVVDMSVISEYAMPLDGNKDVEWAYSHNRFGPILDYLSQHYVALKGRVPAWVRTDLYPAYVEKRRDLLTPE